MQAALSTLYLLAFTASYIIGRKRRNNTRHSPLNQEGNTESRPQELPTLLKRTLDAFKGSLDGFLAATMLMCIAMISAALYVAGEGYKERAVPPENQALPFASSTMYNQVLSVIAAGFSTFPVLVLYMLISQRERSAPDEGTRRRTWLRRAGLFIIWVLLAVEMFLSPRANLDYDDRHNADQEANWDDCNKRGGTRYWQTMKAAQVLVIGLPLISIVVTFFFTSGFGLRGLDRPWVRRIAEMPLVQRLRTGWDLGVAWLNIALTWALLVYFRKLRAEIIESAGAADEANEWGFGQVLTLGTWVPVVLEWLYIFICESPTFYSYLGFP